MAALDLVGVQKSYGRTDILRDVSVAVPEGSLVVVVGPSGCGKSTLLRLVAGLDQPTGGSIHINGRDVTALPPVKRGVAMVFQSYALYPHMTVAENIGFALKQQGSSRAIIARKTAEVAEVLQLTHLLGRKPRDLSGGQQQRVAIGRAMVREPHLFLFDEPLSNLDAGLRVQMRVEICRLQRSLGATMLYVTHDQVEAMTMADQIILLQGGIIEQTGTPLELYHTPANKFVAGFMGAPSMNFLDATVHGVGSRSVSVKIAASATTITIPAQPVTHLDAGEPVCLGIRPEHVRLCSESATDAVLSGQVITVENLGSEAWVFIAMPGGAQVIARCDATVNYARDQRVGLAFAEENCHIFAGSQGLAIPKLQAALRKAA
jgi:multiple sugar transport system ATP-binding protein